MEDGRYTPVWERPEVVAITSIFGGKITEIRNLNTIDRGVNEDDYEI